MEKVALVALAAIAVLFAVDRLALWMERRGWIYWRKRQAKPVGVEADCPVY